MELRILNSNVKRLENLLGDLAKKLDLQPGDTLVTLETEEEVTIGRDVFETLLTQGHLAFEVKGGKTKSRLTEFDPDADKVIMFERPGGG